jgi:hypothetical protein
VVLSGYLPAFILAIFRNRAVRSPLPVVQTVALKKRNVFFAVKSMGLTGHPFRQGLQKWQLGSFCQNSILLSLRQLHDVVGRVLQRDKLPTARQVD